MTAPRTNKSLGACTFTRSAFSGGEIPVTWATVSCVPGHDIFLG
jgi:hypothetical protein